jgi:hypothetical protein
MPAGALPNRNWAVEFCAIAGPSNSALRFAFSTLTAPRFAGKRCTELLTNFACVVCRRVGIPARESLRRSRNSQACVALAHSVRSS